MKHRSLLLVMLGTISSLSVPAESAWYVGGTAGGASVSSTGSDLDKILAKQGITAQSTMNCACTAFKFFAGHVLNNHVAIEGGYADLGEIQASGTFTAPLPGGVFTDNIRVTGITLDAIGSVSPFKNFSLYARLGVVRAKVTADIAATTAFYTLTLSEEKTTLSAHYGLGLTYRLSPHWSLRGEWEGFNKLGDPDTTGQGDIKIYSGGLTYSF